MSDHQTKTRTELLEYIAMLEAKADYLQETIEVEILQDSQFVGHIIGKGIDAFGSEMTSTSARQEHHFMAKHFKEQYEYDIQEDAEDTRWFYDPVVKIQALVRGHNCRWKNPFFTFTD